MGNSGKDAASLYQAARVGLGIVRPRGKYCKGLYLYVKFLISEYFQDFQERMKYCD